MDIFTLKIVYNDNHSENVEIHKDQLSSFIEALKNRECWWANSEKQVGFFTDINKIRYVTMTVKLEAPNDSGSSPCEIHCETPKD